MKSSIVNRKSAILFLCLLSFAFLLLPFVSGCAGSAARQHTLLPVIANMWTELRPFAADVEAVADMDAAVSAGDKAELLADWTIIRPSILEGIEIALDEKQISSHLALSIQELLLRMDAAVAAYSGP